ncbi:MAG: alanine racemase [Synechococcales cyanobacterium RM1_1_8]|nr:alanine racemase [Synechococcales cyanobacterium RM1_1_8]
MVQIAPAVSSPAALEQARAWVEIDLGAIAHNITQLRRLLKPGTALMAVVKADAYGHGAGAVAQTALGAGATWLGVATVMEGIELRRAGIAAPILLLGAVQAAAEVEALVRWGIQPTLSSPAQVRQVAAVLGKLAIAEPLPVHLILDTGMARLGVAWQEAAAFVAQVAAIPSLAIASVYSHLATADDPDPTVMRLQQQNYDAAIAQLHQQGFLPPCLHLANSAATLLQDPSLQYDMVRAGLAVYGLYPAPHLQAQADLRPALQVRARVTQVKRIAAGSGVSYGHRFIAPQDMTVAVVGIGYADGVPRNLSMRLEVLYRGQRLAQLGSITMDQIMVDGSNVPGIAPGDVVTLLGESQDRSATAPVLAQIRAEDWAEMLGTISWEVLCGFRHRLPRVNLNLEAESEG